MKHAMVVVCLALVGLGLLGPGAGWSQVRKSAGPCNDMRAVLFLAGTGESEDRFESNMRQAIQDLRLAPKFCLVPVRWGFGNTAAENYRDQAGHYRAAGRLADSILAIKQQTPDRQIFLVGFDSGTHVVLLAAAMLPPNTVDRIILLSAAVSANYDPCPAVRASRHGLDNFFSRDDGVLREYEDDRGTADGRKGVTAGRLGFLACCQHFPDLAHKFRQYRWVADFDRYMNYGDHFGWIQEPFLGNVVLPMLGSCAPGNYAAKGNGKMKR